MLAAELVVKFVFYDGCSDFLFFFCYVRKLRVFDVYPRVDLLLLVPEFFTGYSRVFVRKHDTSRTLFDTHGMLYDWFFSRAFFRFSCTSLNFWIRFFIIITFLFRFFETIICSLSWKNNKKGKKYQAKYKIEKKWWQRV